MQDKSILVTGGAGFIGSHLIDLLLAKYQASKIINLDALTYASDLNRLTNAVKYDNYVFVKEDIRNAEAVAQLVKDHKVRQVYHLAAETHVDNSISSPRVFFETNVIGTHNLLEACRKLWTNDTSQIKTEYADARFLHISTDEVYGSLNHEGFFTENSNYRPSSPYSASKAASDLMVMSYYKTYSLPVLISNCSNNFGFGQHTEKFIPTIIKSALYGDKIPIYGNGQNIRDWLYVNDHCEALEFIMQHGQLAENYNIGVNNEWSNVDLVKYICQILEELQPNNKKSYLDQIEFIHDRAGHDQRYALDCTKLQSIGWHHKHNFDNCLRTTVKHYVEKYTN